MKITRKTTLLTATKCLTIIIAISLNACTPIKKPTPYDSPYVAKVQTHPYRKQSPSAASETKSQPINNKPAYSNVSPSASPIKVGLLLPLTGKNAALGGMMRDSAMLALFDKYAVSKPAQTIMLLPQNAGETPASAAKAATELAQKGANLLLGPLDSASTLAVKKRLNGKNIPIISFSNDLSVGGNGVYLIGYMQHEQISRIISHINSKMKQHLVVLLPVSDNIMIEEILVKELAKAIIPNVTIVKYGAEIEDFGLVVGQMRNMLQAKKASGAANPDAILMFEGGTRLEKLTNSLAAQSFVMPNVQYYGTGLMDSQTLLGKRDLVGAEFASTSSRNYNMFAKRFEHEYGYSPNKIAALSYDATFVAAELFSGSGATLTRTEGFDTPANGSVRFNANGKNERNLAIIRIENGAFNEIMPAKRDFAE
jgi:ABC-type branched-subunit amino acid transport system substrate-binding protein